MVWFAFLAVAAVSGSALQGGPRVLIAEDHAEFAQALGKLLEADFTVIGIVTSGEQLIERCVELRPDAIVSDIGLDGLDGIAATDRIRRTFPNLPVILITAAGIDWVRAMAEEVGASAVLPKTELAVTLVLTLRELLKLHP